MESLFDADNSDMYGMSVPVPYYMQEIDRILMVPGRQDDIKSEFLRCASKVYYRLREDGGVGLSEGLDTLIALKRLLNISSSVPSNIHANVGAMIQWAEEDSANSFTSDQEKIDDALDFIESAIQWIRQPPTDYDYTSSSSSDDDYDYSNDDVIYVGETNYSVDRPLTVDELRSVNDSAQQVKLYARTGMVFEAYILLGLADSGNAKLTALSTHKTVTWEKTASGTMRDVSTDEIVHVQNT